MNRTLSMIIFVTVATAIYFGLHYFVYKSLTRSIVDNQTWKKALTWFFWISGLSFPLAMTFNRGFEQPIAALNLYATSWMGIIAISFFVFAIQRILALVFPNQAKQLAIGAVAVIGIIVLVSLYNGLRYPGIRQFDIPLKNVPEKLNGFKIVQISDVHLESYSSKKWLEDIINKVNGLKPDLVVVTGDLIDGNVCQDTSFCSRLNKIEAVHGVLAITGNHEYYAGIDLFMDLAARARMKVLRDEAVTIAGELQVVGVEDQQAGSFGVKRKSLEELIKPLDQTKPIILLNHRPLGFANAVKQGVDLQLSGHTHAGQIPPMDLLVWLFYKYPFGLHKRGDAYIYTSNGTGLWGPPMRFLSTNDITAFRLVKREK